MSLPLYGLIVHPTLAAEDVLLRADLGAAALARRSAGLDQPTTQTRDCAEGSGVCDVHCGTQSVTGSAG